MISQHSVQKIQKRGTGFKVPRFFVVLVLVVSCASFSLYAKKKKISHRTMADRQAEAHLVDMPFPVGGVLLPAHNKDKSEPNSSAILTYCVSTTREALIRFYEKEMIRLGWNKLAQSSGDEELLIFETPSKIAIIQMRPKKIKKGWKQNKKIILTLHETSKEDTISF